jgi:hypothetical protein
LSSPHGPTKAVQGQLLPFLRDTLREAYADCEEVPFNFVGGFVGYLGYELKQDCVDARGEMNRCVFVRVCICVYIRMHVCMYVRGRDEQDCIFVHVCACVYVRMCVYACMKVFIYSHMWNRIYTCVYARACVHPHLHLCAYIRVQMCACMCCDVFMYESK